MNRILVCCAALLLGAGCMAGPHTLHIRGEGAGAELIPEAGLMRLGYGNFAFDEASVKAGQGIVVVSDQYGLTTTNLLSRQVFAVIPYCDSTVTIRQGYTPILSICGLDFSLPIGHPETTIKTIPTGK